jgi:hypothetical protein
VTATEGSAVAAVAHELIVALLLMAGLLAAIAAVAAAVLVVVNLGEAARRSLAGRRDARRAETALRVEASRGVAALETYLRQHTG